MQVTLEVVRGPGRGSLWKFTDPGAFLIGRGDDVDLQLSAEDSYASRRHAYLEIAPPVCRIQNLSQKNPLLINRSPVEGVEELRNNDIIEIGFTRLRVTLEIGALPLGEHAQQSNERAADQVSSVDRGLDHNPNEAVSLPQVFSCRVCGADLTAFAESDGRAAELSGSVTYSCPRCLSEGDEHEGKEIASYIVVKCLGVGGMGTVYLAHDTTTYRLVAVKVILDIPEPELALRFDREVSLLRQLSFRHVNRYIDSGTWNKVPYLVTEYLADGNLETIKQRGEVDCATSLGLAIGLASGLDELHSKGIIHRDIKPENILVRHLDNAARHYRWDPVIADFGLALTYARAGGARLTKPGCMLGTAMFMSPEQIRDPHSVAITADIYSAGVTLYYLLTSKYPFEFPTPADVAEFEQRIGRARNPREALLALMKLRQLRHPFVIILEDEPVPVSLRCRFLPQSIARIVDTAVAKDPKRRFRSADEFGRALQSALPEALKLKEQ